MDATHSLNRVLTQASAATADAQDHEDLPPGGLHRQRRRPSSDVGRAARGPEQLLTAVALLLSLGAVAILTLSPAGTGWSWGAPLQELQWYAALSGQARTQLVGNVLLLTPVAAAATLLWPRLGTRAYLPGWVLAAGGAIEVLQWLLPIGRVVSPVDALLNAAGAGAVAWSTAQLRGDQPSGVGDAAVRL